MAYALQLDGANDYLLLDSDIVLTGEFEVSFTIKVSKLSAYNNICCRRNSDTSWIEVAPAGILRSRVFGNATRSTFSGFSGFFDGNEHSVVLRRKADNTFEADIDGVTYPDTSGAVESGAFEIGQIGRYLVGGDFFGGYIRAINFNGQVNLDPDSSDRSGSTNQPILTDTVGGNDATGVGFPAFDPDVWVNLGGDTQYPWWLFQEDN